MQSLVYLLAFQGVTAFPSYLTTRFIDAADVTDVKSGCSVSSVCDAPLHVTNKEIDYDPKNPTAAQKASAARTNCGAQGPCLVFNAAEQYVSTSGQYAYAPPGKTDIRGPCPGLNAAANHGYLPRNGVATAAQTIEGLGSLYGMSADLAGVLAAYAIAFDGDPILGTWSIGGPPGTLLPPNPLLGDPQGISYSHNKYEGDSSIGRCDAYLNGGDAHSLSTVRFGYAYKVGMDNDRYTLDKFSRAFTKNSIRSEKTNALYFAPLFSTTLVSPAAYNFVINFMSNHSAEEPSGYLNGNIFKQFFGIKGEYPNFTWEKGQERIPENWYRRTSTNQYNAIAGVFGDLIPNFLAYPKAFRFGGNVNGTNSYTGIDISNFSNGAYNLQSLLSNPQALACFLYQTEQQAIPDTLSSKAGALILKELTSVFGALTCPNVTKFNDNEFTKFPGSRYHPKGKANNC